MPIAFGSVGTRYVQTANGTSWAVPYPSGISNNDLLVLHIATNGGAVTTPSGWTEVYRETVLSNPKGGMWIKVATGSESGNLTVTTASTTGNAVIARFTGVDPVTPLDASPQSFSSASNVVTTIPAITTVTANTMLVYGNAANSSSVTFTTTGGTQIADYAESAGTGVKAGSLWYEPQAATGTTGTQDITGSSNRANWGAMIALRPGGPPAGTADFSGSGTLTATGAVTGGTISGTVTFAGSGQLAAAGVVGGSAPSLVQRVVGMPSATGTTVAVKVTSATSVRLKVSTDSAGTTGVIYGPSEVPSANGDAKLTVSGLTAGVNYYYRVAMTGASGEILDNHATIGRLRVAPVGQTNFSFNFGSCNTQTDSVAYSAISARNDDLFFHLGDFYYSDGSGTDIDNFRSKFNTKIRATNQAVLYSTTPTTYTPSDHDGMNNNTTNGDDPTAWANWRTVYSELFPSPSTYYSFMYGRVLFIQLDDRNFKTITTATDDANKTALGSVQKQWLKDQITNTTASAIVLIQSSPWIGAPDAGDDGWDGYATERTELANFFSASGKNIVMLGGDMHALAADNGTNAPGGIVMLQAAPFYTSSSIKGGPYSEGTYPATAGTTVQQYGHVDVTDTGSQISFAFTGYSADTNTARITYTKNFTATPSVITGTANFSGSGTLTATGSPNKFRSVSLTGSGTLSASAVTVMRTGAASFTGSGTLIGAATGMSHSRSVALSGSGTLGTQTSVSGTASVSLTGSGALSAVGIPTHTGTASLTGSGILTGAATLITASRNATLTGSGTLSTTRVVNLSGTASLTGSGTLTATGVPAVTRSANLTGSGTLTGTPTAITASRTATLSGSGTLSGVALGVSLAGNASLSGSGTLGVQTGTTGTASASFTGSGALNTSKVYYEPFDGATSPFLSGNGAVYDSVSGGMLFHDPVDLGHRVRHRNDEAFALGTVLSARIRLATGEPRLGGIAFVNPNNLSQIVGVIIDTRNGSGSTAGFQIRESTGTTNVSFAVPDQTILAETWYQISASIDPDGVIRATLRTDNGTLIASAERVPVLYTITSYFPGLYGYGQNWTDDYRATTTVGTPSIGVSATLTGTGTLTGTATAVAASRAAALSGSGTLAGQTRPNLTGSASLSGSGTLTAIGSISSATVTVNLTGSGTLTPSITGVNASRTVAFTGSGSLAGTAVGMSHTATGAFSGSGSLGVQEAVFGTATANFTGSGSLTVETQTVIIRAAGLSGSGTLSSTRTLSLAVTSAFSGSGSLSLSSVPRATVTVNRTGSGTLTTASVAGIARTVNLTGSGTLTYTASPVMDEEVSLTGSGTLTAEADAIHQEVEVDFSGTGSLNPQTATSGSSTFVGNGSGTLIADSDLMSGEADVDLDGSGDLDAAARPAFARTVALTGSGVLSASGRATFSRNVTLTGSGSLTTAAVASAVGAASFSGSGTLTASTSGASQGALSLTGSGTLSATARVSARGTAEFDGTGSLGVQSSTSGTSYMFVSGEGTLSAEGVPHITKVVNFGGSGLITVATQIAVGVSRNFSGSGSLTTSSATEAADLVNFSGSGTLTASARVSASTAVGFAGSGVLTVAPVVSFKATRTFSGLGELEVNGISLIIQRADFSGSGTLVTPATPTYPEIEVVFGKLVDSPYALRMSGTEYIGIVLDADYEKYSGKLVEVQEWYLDIAEREP